jgi:hypothetical protein
VNRVLATRIALAYLALQAAYVAIWILLAPRGFYDTFPTGPAEWVSPLPPYNEHLLRDFGAAGLGLAVLAVLAAVWLDRRLVQATGIVFIVAALPHFAYHLTTTDRLSTSDNLQSLTGLFVPVLAAGAVLWLSRSELLAAGSSPRRATSSEAPR